MIGLIRAPLFLAGLGAVAAVAFALWWTDNHWPTGWEAEQEAVLAGAFIAAFAAFFGIVWKAIFDSLSTKAAHQRDVKAKLLERFLESRATYLEQLNAVSAELATSLGAVADYPDDRGHLEFSFYHSARYVELVAALRARFQRLVPSDHMPGFVLRSQKAERRVWHLLLEPWVFGFSTPQDQSALLDSLRRPQDKSGRRDLLSPREFIEATTAWRNPRSSGLKMAFHKFAESVRKPGRARAMAQVIFVLNRLLGYEMAMVLEPWYGAPAAYPSEEITRARDFFKNDSSVTLENMGVSLPPNKGS